MMKSMRRLNQFFALLADMTLPPNGNPLPVPAESLPSYEGAFLKMILTLLALIVGMIGTIWFLKRMAAGRLGAGSGSSIKLIEKKPLSPKTMLYLIEVEGKQSVIAESQLEIKHLMTLDSITESEKQD